jgi:hypothetical protein
VTYTSQPRAVKNSCLQQFLIVIQAQKWSSNLPESSNVLSLSK